MIKSLSLFGVGALVGAIDGAAVYSHVSDRVIPKTSVVQIDLNLNA